MFCPMIKGECKGSECRDWDGEKQKCIAQVDRERTEQRDAQLEKWIAMQKEFLHLTRMSEVWNKVQFNIVLLNPTVPDEIKDAIRKAMAAPSGEVAEQLLREAGLLE
ncbi:unnamed protein product [marine sediment metagenome]|uniref:Uncharacterized protein n=1 Tax=marine sediment metagenome TaxID=412755 RepID=X1IW52_9ZZZZ